MPRLLSCSVCAKLYGQLHEGRCAECHARLVFAKGQPQKGESAWAAKLRRCKSCDTDLPGRDFPHRGTVANVRVRGFCRFCIELYKAQRLEERKHEPRPYQPMPPRIKQDGRECRTCYQFLPWSRFKKDGNPTGYRASCVTCMDSPGYTTKPTSGRVTDEGRECSICRVMKPWAEYNKAPNGTNGRASMCRSCNSKRRSRKYAG